MSGKSIFVLHVCLLARDRKNSDKFWKLEERIKTDKKACGVQCEMKRSNLFFNIMSLLGEGTITLDDLNNFSDDLKETIEHFAKR